MGVKYFPFLTFSQLRRLSDLFRVSLIPPDTTLKITFHSCPGGLFPFFWSRRWRSGFAGVIFECSNHYCACRTEAVLLFLLSKAVWDGLELGTTRPEQPWWAKIVLKTRKYLTNTQSQESKSTLDRSQGDLIPFPRSPPHHQDHRPPSQVRQHFDDQWPLP